MNDVEKVGENPKKAWGKDRNRYSPKRDANPAAVRFGALVLVPNPSDSGSENFFGDRGRYFPFSVQRTVMELSAVNSDRSSGQLSPNTPEHTPLASECENLCLILGRENRHFFGGDRLREGIQQSGNSTITA